MYEFYDYYGDDIPPETYYEVYQTTRTAGRLYTFGSHDKKDITRYLLDSAYRYGGQWEVNWIHTNKQGKKIYCKYRYRPEWDNDPQAPMYLDFYTIPGGKSN